MASPNVNWTDILTTTLYARQKTLADNMMDNNGFLRYMKKASRRRPVSGGAAIVEHLEYADSTNFAYIDGYETFPIAAQELFTSAEFAWKEAVCAITISGREMGINADSEFRMLDLLESRVKNGEKTLMNNLAIGTYSDGTGSSSKQVGGLQLLVADVPTSGTVAGINRATYSFWRNYYLGASTSGTGSVTSTNIQSHMNTVIANTTRGNDRASVWFMDNNFYTKFMGSLQTIQRITDVETGEAGFQKLRYAGMDVVMDGGVGGACPANHAYALNLDYLSYRPHDMYEFAVLDPDRHATNQNALVRVLYWMGNMTLSNAFVQGVLTNA